MYNKDEFIRNIKGSTCFEELSRWIVFYSKDDDLEIVKRRFRSFNGKLLDLYLSEAGKFYANLKCFPLSCISVNQYGILLDGSVYDFKPLSNIAMMGTIYAMIQTDCREWFGEDKAKGEMILACLDRIDTNAALHLKFLMEGARPKKERRLDFKDMEKLYQEEKGMEKESIKQAEIRPVSSIFSQDLQVNTEKRNALKHVLCETICPTIKQRGRSRDNKWKWPHVQEAMFRSNHLVSKDNKAEFGRAIGALCGEKADNIEQSFKRYSSRPTDDNIIARIQELIDNAISNAGDTEVVIEERPLTIRSVKTQNDNFIEDLVSKTLCVAPYFQYYVKEQDVRDMYISMFDDASMKERAQIAFQSENKDVSICKVIGVLRQVGIIKTGVSDRELIYSLNFVKRSKDSRMLYIIKGFADNQPLHDFIYNFWMRRRILTDKVDG